MQYLCVKQLSVGGAVYYPGNMIPSSVVLPERVVKLIKNGYLSEMKGGKPDEEQAFTKEEVDNMVAEAVAKAAAETKKEMEEQLAELQKYAAELEETELGAYDGTIQIVIKGISEGENEQFTAVPARADEIQQVFAIMQMSAEEGAKEITEVRSENILILLHAADSRKTIKNAAKEQADKLFSVMKGAGG